MILESGKSYICTRSLSYDTIHGDVDFLEGKTYYTTSPFTFLGVDYNFKDTEKECLDKHIK